jgi:predicted O-methyltransferase YrrM
LDLPELLQGTCGLSPEQANEVLKEFKRVHFDRGSGTGVIPARFDAPEEFASLCYCISRLKRPSTVVETGVGRGVTSYYVLRALEENGKGHLYSIELPMLTMGAKDAVGQLVPAALRSRWTLVFGPGTRQMKKLRGKLGNLDIFIHDSNHLYLNQLAEYRIALTWMNEGGILVSHDVENDALLEASEQFGCQLMVTRDGKSKFIGVILR